MNKNLITTVLLLSLTGCASNQDDNFPVSSSDQSFGIEKSVLANDGSSKGGDKPRAEVELDDDQKFAAEQLPSLPTLVDVNIPSPNDTPRFAQDSEVTVAVDEISIVDFIHHVFGDLMELDYILSPDVEKSREKVILKLQSPVTRTELFTIASNLLIQNGIRVSSKDNIIFFSKQTSSDKTDKAIGIGGSPEDIPDVSGKIIQLVPYVYNSSSGIQRIASKLSDASIFAYDEQKLMMIEGTRDQILRVQRLVEMLDVPAIKGRDIRLLSLAHVSASEMVKSLQNILREEGLRVGSLGDTALVPIERQNIVIVYSSDRTIGARVTQWAEKLDKPQVGDKPGFYIFRPQYSKAEDINEALTGFVETLGENAQSSKGAIGNGYQLKISVDKVQNSLLINATPADHKELLGLLEKLDRLPGQVALDVTIAEIDLGDDFKAGITSLVADSSKSSQANSGIINLNPFSGRAGISAVVGAATINLEFIESKTDVKVLSRPYIVVQDGQSASINSGKQVPVQVGSSTTDGGTSKTDVQYRSTGINLSVSPVINADGVVALKVSQSVSKTEDGPTDLNPIITNRSVTTQVMVGDGQTAILGGLVQENKSKGHNGIPFFKDLPLIGGVFQGHSEKFARSELVILITPKILRSTTDLDDFSRSIDDAFSFPIEMGEIGK